MPYPRIFSSFQTLLLAVPAIFLLSLIRFWTWFLYPLPTNALEFTIAILFALWLIGLLGFGFPRPRFSSWWQIIAVGLFLAVATVATAKLVLTMSLGRSVPLGIWKGWFIVPACYFLMLVSCFRTKSDLVRLIETSTGFVALTSLVMLLQFITGWFSEITATYDHRLVWPYLDVLSGKGTSGNYPAMFLAPFLCLGWISWLRSNTTIDRLFYGACVLAIAATIYFTKSYGAWIAIIGACSLSSFFVLEGKKRWILVPLMTLLLFGGLYLDQKNSEKFQFALDSENQLVIGSGEERLNIWKTSIDLIKRDPLWGVGQGQFQRAFERQSPYTLDREVSRQEINHALHSHNVYLMFWLSNGIFGVISFLFLIAVWLIPLPREWRWTLTAPLLYFLAHGLIDTMFWKIDLAYTFWFFGALLSIAQNQNLVSGKVEHGIKVGRTLGFPTANLRLDLDLDKPHGVYVVETKLGKEKKKGLLYFGPRMVEGLPEEIVCEMTILDFKGDLYGKKITFKLGKKIRGPLWFKSPQDLKKQIEKDVLIARNLK